MGEEQSSAAVAAQHVQAIVAAAEESARQIREQARAEAGAAVDGLVEQAAALRARIEELEAAVVELKARVEGMPASAAPPPASTAAASTATEPAPASAEPAPEPAMASAPVPEEAVEADPEPQAAEPEPQSASEPAAAGTAAPEGARLIALNMALSGRPRDETARYLRENFEFDGADALLDEVYAKVGS